MTDIVERLQNAIYENAPSRCMEAAREIKRLRAALEPFAKMQPVSIGFAAVFAKPDWADCNWAVGFDGLQPEFKHFETARTVLTLPPTLPVPPCS